jgi:hypothetical protein
MSTKKNTVSIVNTPERKNIRAMVDLGNGLFYAHGKEAIQQLLNMIVNGN